jgi:cation transport ATPase
MSDSKNAKPINLEPVDQERAGLEHQVQQLRSATNFLRQQIVDLKQQIAAVLGQFRELANVHNFENRFLPGHESFTWSHDGQTRKAKTYRLLSVCATVAAVVFGVYFTGKSLTAESWLALYIGAAVMAFVLGMIGGGILWTSIGAHPERPHASRNVNIAVAISGITLFALTTLFAWSRFVRHALNDWSAATLIAGIELSAILLGGAFLCGYGIFIWSKNLDDRNRVLRHKLGNYETQLAEKEEQLAQKVVALQEGQYRRRRGDTVRPEPEPELQEVV